jgi:D-arabinose 1-dehydrogenase-like Zn-dependent alcohol dehydrogenase
MDVERTMVTAVESGPLMCADLTMLNWLRYSGAKPGDLVAVLGVGGLGHLAIQFAAKMGCKTVAIARGTNKEPLARQLGAVHYIDSQSHDPAVELSTLGGATVILTTATSTKAIAAVLPGLGIGGTMIVLRAAADPLCFSALTGVRSMNEVFPLEHAAEAYDRMMGGNARFRVVLATGQ